MNEETSMLELLDERLEKEDIVKLVCNYDNKFNKLEENNKQLKSQLQQKDKEIERLNNIINELEKYICAIEYDERHYNETWQIAVRIHNKLKELKGSDKE